jgi:nucleoside-diphosphate-sugar epimerase
VNTDDAPDHRPTLVTGAAGFIGSHLCRALAAHGVAVEAWVRPRAASGAALRRALPDIAVHEVDMRDAPSMAAALASRPPGRVFHLAGIRLIGNHAGNLATMFETQVQGTLNLLRRLAPDARVVMAGSCEEYGQAVIPFEEDGPALARTAYAVSRLATTLACCALSSPEVCVARLAVVYGPQQLGEMFIPSLMAACTEGRPFAMSSGEQTRDFLYIDDAVRALIALADTEAAMHQVVNVGSSLEVTVREVAEQAARLAGNSGNLRIGAIASRPGEATRYVCAIGKIRKLTGWQPQVPMSEGLARTLEWWRQRTPGV